MALSEVANANFRFISDCLAEAGIETDKDNVLIKQQGCVMIASPEEAASNYIHVRDLCCHLEKSTMERGLAVISNALRNRTEGGESNG